MGTRPGSRLSLGVALIGVVGALLGSGITGVVAVLIQGDELNEQRAAEARSERAAVYGSFLSAANEYAVETQELVSPCARAAERSPDARFDCQPRFRGWNPARADYQGAINDVYVFGSDEAVDASEAVSAELPPALIGLDYSQAHLKLNVVDEAEFTDAYQSFLGVMCQEVSAEPRPGCGDG